MERVFQKKIGGYQVSKLKSQEAKIEIGGNERIVQLIPQEPHPSDEFIPKQDKLAVMLRFSISKEERRQPYPIRTLKKILDPKIVFSRKMCSVVRRLRIADGRHWYTIVYHMYDYDYGAGIYYQLLSKLFR